MTTDAKKEPTCLTCGSDDPRILGMRCHLLVHGASLKADAWHSQPPATEWTKREATCICDGNIPTVNPACPCIHPATEKAEWESVHALKCKCGHRSNLGNRIVRLDGDCAQLRAAVRRALDERRRGGPMVLCLCGSNRFSEAYTKAHREESLQGHIVLSIGLKAMAGDGPIFSAEQKEVLDELHLRKIDLADEVLVLDVGGYVGDTTEFEIAYATKHGKRIRYLESTRATAAEPLVRRNDGI